MNASDETRETRNRALDQINVLMADLRAIVDSLVRNSDGPALLRFDAAQESFSRLGNLLQDIGTSTKDERNEHD